MQNREIKKWLSCAKSQLCLGHGFIPPISKTEETLGKEEPEKSLFHNNAQSARQAESCDTMLNAKKTLPEAGIHARQRINIRRVRGMNE